MSVGPVLEEYSQLEMQMPPQTTAKRFRVQTALPETGVPDVKNTRSNKNHGSKNYATCDVLFHRHYPLETWFSLLCED